jgi:AcrR family transcriptional regulator
MTSVSNKVRRPGYAPSANVTVGRRGRHTRDRIVEVAKEVFLQNGFHGTSVDMIAKAAGASRATIYQYFADTEDIFDELARDAVRAAVEHAGRLGPLGPTPDGLANLEAWMHEWADIYDAHAAVFAEYPGVGTVMGLTIVDTHAVPEKFRHLVTERLSSAQVRGLDLADAAAALMRIPHMVNLYRHRGMFGLPSRGAVSTALAIAMQSMLFPEPASRTRSESTVPDPTSTVASGGQKTPPIRQDVLAAGSRLFAERGYYAVRMEDIAAAADVSRATLYRYFSNKDVILAELTRAAMLETESHATALRRLAAEAFDSTRFWRWALDYVGFHRTYSGVIRAWFDGTVAERLSGAEVSHGIASLHDAVATLLGSVTLPDGVDPATAAAVFLATLGRMTEPTPAGDSDGHAAEVIAELLSRSLLG